MLVFLVAGLNISFNAQAQRTATSAASWSGGIVSFDFLLLFALGCGSLLALYTLYAQQVLLARGILLMGAVSIFGRLCLWHFGERKPFWIPSNISILAAIILLLGYRIVIAR